MQNRNWIGIYQGDWRQGDGSVRVDIEHNGGQHYEVCVVAVLIFSLAVALYSRLGMQLAPMQSEW